MQKGVVRKRPRKQQSEYGRQLQEKQELKAQYNLREKQFKKYITGALLRKEQGSDSPEQLMRALEKRLDSVVFRMGMAQTRKQARQMVSHGHFLVNGKKVDIPSYTLSIGEVIGVRESSKKGTLFTHIALALKKYTPPSWIQLDKEKLEAIFTQDPTVSEIAPTVEVPLIFEFYSR